MFCFQCQETAGNKGCAFAQGVCGKPAPVAETMDVLIYVLKGVSILAEKGLEQNKFDNKLGLFIAEALFTTITNANFDQDRIEEQIEKGLAYQKQLHSLYGGANLPPCAVWQPSIPKHYLEAKQDAAVTACENEDVRSLRELLIYGLKGIAAYAHHAAVLGFEDENIYKFLVKGLASTVKDLPVNTMIDLVLEAGNVAVTTMALLDKANTETYGTPEITTVELGTRNNPGILISGHDLKDLHELLEQTAGTGVDVYTHSEMLPAHYYPAFKKYPHFAGNYGNAWWKQNEEFASFSGPILMTTNCIVPVKESYKNRIFTTGQAGYPGVTHIADRKPGGSKDFTQIIELAKTCSPPVQIEAGQLVGGFAHAQVLALADKVIDAVKSGAIKRFVVMAGCDGRHTQRSYFTDIANTLPEGTVILTAGCAKYRYNKLNLGDIGGIPRVLDAGQCNDSYSLAIIALKLKEAFGLEDVNELPLSFDIAWYEQKAVAVLLALLSLGFTGMRLGPTLPAFLSPAVVKVLVENFDIKPIGKVKDDVEAMMAGN